MKQRHTNVFTLKYMNPKNEVTKLLGFQITVGNPCQGSLYKTVKSVLSCKSRDQVYINFDTIYAANPVSIAAYK